MRTRKSRYIVDSAVNDEKKRYVSECFSEVLEILFKIGESESSKS
jgi:hypothetical protein